MLQSEETITNDIPDVSTIKALNKKFRAELSTGLRKRLIHRRNSDSIINEYSDSDNEGLNEDDNIDLLYFSDKNKVIAVKDNTFISNEENKIVEYRHTNFSLKAKKIIDDLTVNKLIKNPLVSKRDIINDTVDAWAKTSRNTHFKHRLYQDRYGRVRYKPLIFGGTYPIDVPELPNNFDTHVKTFDIDRPLSFR